MGYVFIVVWSLVALGLGSVFAFIPQVPADIYISMMAANRVTNRLRENLAPRGSILVWYRLGGIVFMIAGVVVPVLVFTGVLPMRGV